MTAIKNVRLINGTGKAPEENVTLLIKDGIFCKIRTDTVIPDGCSVIDGSGLTAIPGLIDAHTHFGGSASTDYPGFGSRQETYQYVQAREGFLNWGVTAVRTCGDQMDDILAFRDDADAGKILSPRIMAAGGFFQAEEGHPFTTVYFRNEAVKEKAAVFVNEDTPIEEKVDEFAKKGVDFIKAFYAHVNAFDYPNSVPRMTFEQLKRIVDSAHRNGLKCGCHIDGSEEMMAAAKAGVDIIDHMANVGNTEDVAFTDEVVKAVKESGATVIPTLIETYRIQQFMPTYKDCATPAKGGVKKLYEAGVPLGVGCDSGVPFVPHGESLHDEMQNLVEAGIPSAEVIRMATSVNAKVLGMEDKIGTIEEGKEADLILLGSDPLADISATKDIRLVMMKGHIIRECL